MKHLKTALIAGSMLSLGMLLTPAHARSLDTILKTKTLNIVTTASSPPHGFVDPKTNTLQGIMVDVGRAVGKHLGVSVKFINVPFSGLIPTLSSGRADFMSAPLFITPERAKAVDFTVPIYGWGEGIIVSAKTKAHYKSFQDLKGHKVGTLVDSVQYRMLKDMPGTTVSTYQDYPSLLADVRAGRIDLGLIDPPSIIYQIKANSIPGLKIDSQYKPQNQWEVGGAVEKGNTKLLEAVNHTLEKMKKDGELHAILKKWGVANLQAK